MRQWVRGLGALLLVLVVLNIGSMAVPGDADDPVVTRAYLWDTYLPSLAQRTADFLQSDAAPLGALEGRVLELEAVAADPGALSSIVARRLRRDALLQVQLYAESPQLVTLGYNDVLRLGQGSTVSILDGSGRTQGFVMLDLTTGQETGDAAGLTAQHSYMSLGSQSMVLSTSTQTRVAVKGYYRLEPAPVIAHKELCDALMAMGLINTYELDRPATRMEMFVIFLTILGELDDANVYTGPSAPFTDITWGGQLVSYLLHKGHTAGTGNNKFSGNQQASVQQMCLIMLRALGYENGVDMGFATATQDAVRLGLFSQAEMDALTSDQFFRDSLVYMTYYSLGATYKNTSTTVLDRLISEGLVSREAAMAAMNAVTAARYS